MLRLAKFFYLFAFKTRLYFLWSRLYRFLFHRKYKGVKLDQDISPVDATKKMRILKWTKDSIKEMGDAVGSPHWVQFCINEVSAGKPQPAGALDCDEFAVWSASCIDKNLFPGCLNVFWRGEKFSGHNVCMYHVGTVFFYTGNWGMIGPFTNLKDIILDIIKRAAGPNGELVGWTLFSANLYMHLTDTELP